MIVDRNTNVNLLASMVSSMSDRLNKLEVVVKEMKKKDEKVIGLLKEMDQVSEQSYQRTIEAVEQLKKDIYNALKKQGVIL